jgi:hypothetical protein
MVDDKCEHFIQANSEGRYRLVDLLAVIGWLLGPTFPTLEALNISDQVYCPLVPVS